MLRHPAGYAFARLYSDVSNLRGMRKLRRAKHHFAIRLGQIDQTSVAEGYFGCQPDQFAKHLVKRRAGADDLADLVEKIELGSHRPFLSVVRGPDVVQS